MLSLRTKITRLTVCMIVIAVVIVTLLSVLFIRNTEHMKSEQLLLLLCETGEKNLDYYFNNVEKSVGKVSSYAENDLEGLETEQLVRHIDHVRAYFGEMANRTNGVLTYYYRIDPEVSRTVKGFWYTNLDGEGFEEHEVTDITRYDTEDTSKLVWFTVPKVTGEPIWLPPYITDNLDVRVLSYNVPIYWKGQFIGIVGIEIDYSTMAKQVESIRLYSNGYAFINDAEGNLVFHPRIDVTKLTEETRPAAPDGLLSDSTFIRYTFDGVEKQAAWLPLCNGMRLNVAVPISETVGDWQNLIWEILLSSALVLVVLSGFTVFLAGKMTRPLRELTEAAERTGKGNYAYTPHDTNEDEVGRLAKVFHHLESQRKDLTHALNKRETVDALTSVRNRVAFSSFIEELQAHADETAELPAFAVGVFDCNDLNLINSQYGHEKGDIYLKTASRLICRVFQHSPVFRIGGDEFAVVLRNEDYQNRAELLRQFERDEAALCASTENRWEQAQVTMGLAVYDPQVDASVIDVVRRADKIMYANMRARSSLQ